MLLASAWLLTAEQREQVEAKQRTKLEAFAAVLREGGAAGEEEEGHEDLPKLNFASVHIHTAERNNSLPCVWRSAAIASLPLAIASLPLLQWGARSRRHGGRRADLRRGSSCPH